MTDSFVAFRTKVTNLFILLLSNRLSFFFVMLYMVRRNLSFCFAKFSWKTFSLFQSPPNICSRFMSGSPFSAPETIIFSCLIDFLNYSFLSSNFFCSSSASGSTFFNALICIRLIVFLTTLMSFFASAFSLLSLIP